MKINVDEIASLIKKQVDDYNPLLKDEEVGYVIDVGDGIARVYGLNNVMYGEILTFENDVLGLALNLEENIVGVVILGDFLKIFSGSVVKRTKHLLRVPVGENLVGRVINPLGVPLDGKGSIDSKDFRPIEVIAPGIAERQPVNSPLHTGIKAIDSMIPIGKGQRELIIGDRQTGKTTVAIDTIINQKGSGVICVYIAIGQKNSTVSSLVECLKKYGAMEHTIVVVAGASDPASLLYIAPYAGCAMAEYFTYDKKGDSLCVYDDLSKHANAYRQLSLLLRRPPGREAFPGDVFYLHSRLLERAVRLNDENGGGSLTALPIIETQEGEVSAYIPTNVVSITDGQIYLSPKLFASGIRPAVDVGISVSRVGGNAQTKAMKKVSGRLRLDMAQFRSLEAFTQMGTDLDKNTQKQLRKGYILVEILKQKQYSPMPVEDQIIMIYLATNDFIDFIDKNLVGDFELKFLEWFKEKNPQLISSLKRNYVIESQSLLDNAINNFVSLFKKQIS